MTKRALQFFFGLIAITAFSFLIAPTTRAALPCEDEDTTGDNPPLGSINCPIGDVCVAGDSCVNFDLEVTSVVPGATSITATVESNASRSHSIQIQYCLGNTATCSTPSTRPAAWSPLSASATTHVVPFSGLRPGRTYTMSFYSTFEGAPAQATAQATTFPLPAFTPVSSNVADTTATISWNTSFSGNSVVHYGLSAPRWVGETANTGSSWLVAATALPTGEAWVVGANGVTLHRPDDTQAVRDWVRGTGTGSTFFVGVDTLDGSRVWAAAYFGKVYTSVDRGATWTEIPTGIVDDLYAVATAAPTTAWVAGRSGRVMYYNGTSWVVKRLGSVGTALNTIFSLDDRSVWIGGTGRELISTTDQGSSWNLTVLPGSTTETILSIASLDGANFWAGGTGGSLWRYTGSSWSAVSFPTSESISNISMIGPDDFYFTADSRIGHYQSGIITFSSQFSSTFGVDPTALAFAHGARGIAAGSGHVASFGISGGNIQTGTGTTAHQVNMTGLVPGAQYHYAAVSTGSGVANGGLGTFTTTSPDTIPPTISITNPGPSPFYTNAPFIMSGSASDNIAVVTTSSSIKLNYSHATGGGVVVTNVTPALPNAGPVAWSTALAPGLAVGLNTITATACDAVQCTTTPPKQVFLDNQGPTVTITSPTSGSTVTTSTITVTGTASDNDQVETGQYQLNGGTRQTFTFTPDANPTLSFSLPGLVLGTNTLQIFVQDRAGNEAASSIVTFTYAQPTFDLAVSPTTQTIPAGQSTTYTVTVTPRNGFTGSVNLALSGSPAGSTVTFTQNPVVLGASAVNVTMTIQTSATPTGTFNMTITGTSGAIIKTVPVELIIITPPDFSLSSSPNTRTVLAGTGTTYSITATANPTYAGTINPFTVLSSPSGPLPTGVSATFAPTSLTLANGQSLTTTLSITTTAATPGGTYTLRVSGTDNVRAITRFVDITLVVNQPPDVQLTVLPAPPASITIAAGGAAAANYNGKAIALNGYNRPSIVTASVGSVIPGLLISITPSNFVPAVGPSGTDFVMSITADSRVPGGNYTVTVTLRADDNSLTKTAQVLLVITGDNTPPVISITQPDVNPNYDRVTVAWRTNELANSRLEIYQDSARTILVGIMSDPAYVTTRSMVYVGLNPLTTYYAKVVSSDQAPSANTGSAITFDDGSPLLFTTLDTPDFIPPTITITQPSAGQTVLGTVSITGTATDNKIVSTIIITVYHPGGAQAYSQTLTPGTATYDYVVAWNSLTGRINGLHTITAQATDTAGNLSPVASVTVNVQNDLTKPVVAQNYPEAINLICDAGTGKCQITIHWFTDDASTSRVEYAREDTYFSSGYALTADYDNSDATTSPSVPVHTEHTVTLTNLDKNFLYHYRITSCNISGDCTN